MAVIEWGPKLETGIPKIDFQHQNLVNLINALENASNEPDVAVKEMLTSIVFDQLIEYTGYHFQFEEELMTKVNFAEFAEHKAAHDKFKASAVAMQKRFQNKEDIMKPLLAFLGEWLKEHILGTDMKYIPALKMLDTIY